MPSRVLNYKTPLDLLKSCFPDSRFFTDLDLRIFGCTAFVHIHDQHRSKLDLRSHKCIFLGYSSTQKGYRCYSPSLRKYFVSRDVTFFEHQSFYPNQPLEGENSGAVIFWDNSSSFLEFKRDPINPTLRSDVYNPIWEYLWDPNPISSKSSSDPQSSQPIPHLSDPNHQSNSDFTNP